MHTGLYKYELKNSLKLLDEDRRVRAADRRLILAFLKQVKAQEVSIGRPAKYVKLLRRSAQLVSRPFRAAKRPDIEDLFTKLADFEFKAGRRYSPETMADFRMAMKRFMKFVRYGDTDRDTPWPEEVRWLRKNVKESETEERRFFTDDEVVSMLKAATTPRDRALIALLAELATRPGEGPGLKVGDVQFDDAGAVVHVKRGKTGSRTLRLIASAKYPAEHVESHPFKEDPEAPLWLTTSLNHLHRPLSWVAAARLVKGDRPEGRDQEG